MLVTLLKSKILRAKVSDSNLHYEGSLGIDRDLMNAVGLLPYEKILVGNLNTGDRFETYAIEREAGSGAMELNGAVARLGEVGDLLVILSFAQVDESEVSNWKPKVLVLKEE
jgi:aspartate 1-decarboxylase